MSKQEKGPPISSIPSPSVATALQPMWTGLACSNANATSPRQFHDRRRGRYCELLGRYAQSLSPSSTHSPRRPLALADLGTPSSRRTTWRSSSQWSETRSGLPHVAMDGAAVICPISRLLVGRLACWGRDNHACFAPAPCRSPGTFILEPTWSPLRWRWTTGRRSSLGRTGCCYGHFVTRRACFPPFPKTALASPIWWLVSVVREFYM